MGVALVSAVRPLPVLPLLAARRRDARRGRQPRAREHHGHQPHRRAPVVVGDRHDLRRDVGRAPRARPRAQRAAAHPARRAGVRRRRDRLLLQPAAHVPRRPAARHRCRALHQVRRRRAVARRPSREPPVHRAVHRVARDAAAPAHAPPTTSPAATARRLHRAGSRQHPRRGRGRRAAGIRSRHRGHQARGLDTRRDVRRALPVARASRAHLGPGVAVPTRLRGGRGRGLWQSGHRPRHPLAAGAHPRRADHGARWA